MNWGYRIAILYSSFALFMFTMVALTFQYRVNLVDKDYYKQEIAYQAEIDKMQRVNQLDQKPALTFNTESRMLELNLPFEEAHGEILFFRPSDAKKDFKIPLMLHHQTQAIPCKGLPKGMWRLKINWQSDGKTFYLEQKIQVLDEGRVKVLS